MTNRILVRETTDECFQSNSIFEAYENPLPGKVGTPTLLIQGLRFELIRLIVGCWLLSGPVIDCGPIFAVRGASEVGGVPLRTAAPAGARLDSSFGGAGRGAELH